MKKQILSAFVACFIVSSVGFSQKIESLSPSLKESKIQKSDVVPEVKYELRNYSLSDKSFQIQKAVLKEVDPATLRKVIDFKEVQRERR